MATYSIASITHLHGNFTISKTTGIAEGEWVYFSNPIPDNGYCFDHYDVEWASGSFFMPNDNNGFNMPASDVRATCTFIPHTLTWDKAATLNISQNGYLITANMTGHVTDSGNSQQRAEQYRHSISYMLRVSCNDTPGAAPETYPFNSATIESTHANSVSFYLTDSDMGKTYTFKLIAKCEKLGTESVGKTQTYIPKSVHKTIRYLSNGQWVECVPYYNVNGEWQEVEPYYLKDGAWIPCSHT